MFFYECFVLVLEILKFGARFLFVFFCGFCGSGECGDFYLE